MLSPCKFRPTILLDMSSAPVFLHNFGTLILQEQSEKVSVPSKNGEMNSTPPPPHPEENSAMRHLCEDFNLNGTRSIRGLTMKWIRIHACVLPALDLGSILHLRLGIAKSQKS